MLTIEKIPASSCSRRKVFPCGNRKTGHVSGSYISVNFSIYGWYLAFYANHCHTFAGIVHVAWLWSVLLQFYDWAHHHEGGHYYIRANHCSSTNSSSLTPGGSVGILIASVLNEQTSLSQSNFWTNRLCLREKLRKLVLGDNTTRIILHKPGLWQAACIPVLMTSGCAMCRLSWWAKHHNSCFHSHSNSLGLIVWRLAVNK